MSVTPKRIVDLKLTGMSGGKFLVNAFDIALVYENKSGETTITLKVPVAIAGGGSSRYFEKSVGLEIQVKESLDTIAEMRADI